jgi:RNase H-fold protein (predicted Holliday junction resolvase)
MKQMGEFILLAAQTAAAENGIEAEGVVRHGNVADEIVNLCDELDADYAVLGQPGSAEETNSFAMQQFKDLVERIEATGTKVILIQGKQA